MEGTCNFIYLVRKGRFSVIFDYREKESSYNQICNIRGIGDPNITFHNFVY